MGKKIWSLICARKFGFGHRTTVRPYDNRDFKQGLRKCLVRRVLAAEKWNEYVESRQNSKLLCTLSKSRSTEVYNLSR